MLPQSPDDSRPRQRILDFGHGVASARADFLISPSNQAAVAWIDKWPEWPDCALALAGPDGSGKSHLANIWATRSKAMILEAVALSDQTLPALLAANHGLVMEGSKARIGDVGFEEALFHLYNTMRSGRRSLLLVDADPPARWPVQLPDLASRLATIPVATIQAPDDSLLEALFYKLFADRQLQVSPDVVNYILPRIERSFAAVHDIVEQLDKTALERKTPITIATARLTVKA